MVPWIPVFDKVPPSGMLQFREEDCITLPSDEGQQVELQLGEDVTLYQVRNGQLNINVGTLISKPTTIWKIKNSLQSTLDNYIKDIIYNHTQGRIYTLDNYTPTKDEMKEFYTALNNQDIQKKIKDKTLTHIEFPEEFDKNTQKEILNFIQTHKNKDIEYGFIFDYKNSKILNGLIKGTKEKVILDYSKISNKNKHTFTLHHHPEHGLPGPSSQDIRNLLVQSKEDYALVSSKNELWIVKYKGTMNIEEANKIMGNMDKLLTRSEYAKKKLSDDFKYQLHIKQLRNIKKYRKKYPKKYRAIMRKERELDKQKFDKMLDILFQEEANRVRVEYLNEIGVETVRIKL